MQKQVTPRPKRLRRRIFLREWRKHRQLSQERLGARVGMTQGMISHLETGESDYTGSTLELLADALQCEPQDILMRNPLDSESPWTIWEALKPEQRRQAIRVLKALAEEAA